MNCTNERLSSERGVSMVEMAIALPLLVIFIAGIVDFGLGFQRLNSISTAARTGSTFGAQHSSTARTDLGDTHLACGNQPEAPCGGMQNSTIGNRTPVTEAAKIATCRYLDSVGLADGNLYNVEARILTDSIAGLNPNAISIPTTKRIVVTVAQNANVGHDKFCIVCADHFVPGLAKDSIRAEFKTIIGTECL